MKLRLIFLLLCATFTLSAAEQDNVLFYKDSVQLSTEISPYDILVQDKPIYGTLMVTHNDTVKVDDQSIKMGTEPIKSKFIKQVTLDPNSKLVISIYQFQLKGHKKGNYELPPVTAKVGGKEYQAPPLNIDVGE